LKRPVILERRDLVVIGRANTEKLLERGSFEGDETETLRR